MLTYQITASDLLYPSKLPFVFIIVIVCLTKTCLGGDGAALQGCVGKGAGPNSFDYFSARSFSCVASGSHSLLLGVVDAVEKYKENRRNVVFTWFPGLSQVVREVFRKPKNFAFSLACNWVFIKSFQSHYGDISCGAGLANVWCRVWNTDLSSPLSLSLSSVHLSQLTT